MATKIEIVQGCIEFFEKRISTAKARIKELESSGSHGLSIKWLNEDIDSDGRAIKHFEQYLSESDA